MGLAPSAPFSLTNKQTWKRLEKNMCNIPKSVHDEIISHLEQIGNQVLALDKILSENQDHFCQDILDDLAAGLDTVEVGARYTARVMLKSAYVSEQLTWLSKLRRTVVLPRQTRKISYNARLISPTRSA